jgi:membrane protease YdiL (CAAX protease family)
MDDQVSPVLYALFLGISLASMGALLYLFQKHIGGQRLLAYEPRKRVPWGFGIALLAMIFPFMGIVLALTDFVPEGDQQTVVEEHVIPSIEEEETAAAEEPNNFVINGLSSSLVMIAFVVVLGLFLHASLHADGRDLGLPQSRTEVIRDMRAGAVACAATLLPIYVVQYLLTVMLEPQSQHPLVDELQQTHTPAMMLVGFLLVVVAAPLSEEFAFRLLLQGWLEKFEDELMGFTATLRPEPQTAAEIEEPLTEEPLDEAAVIAFPVTASTYYDVSHELPREGLLPGLPHGWLPILASGTLFGLAHLGHGVSPVPLVLFGIVLGYLYQRTHRLVASITAHALFNAYSMTVLWLNLQ